MYGGSKWSRPLKPAGEVSAWSRLENYIQHTHPAPVEAVSNGVFRPMRVRNYPCVDMLDFNPVAWCVLSSAPAVVDMNVSAHRRTNEITHHRRSIVIRRELAASQLNVCLIRSVNSPVSLRHRAMASFVILLGVTFKGPTKGRK
jgi:hypothetical protein